MARRIAAVFRAIAGAHGPLRGMTRCNATGLLLAAVVAGLLGLLLLLGGQPIAGGLLVAAALVPAGLALRA
jgi:hypothetical protein